MRYSYGKLGYSTGLIVGAVFILSPDFSIYNGCSTCVDFKPDDLTIEWTSL